MVLLYKLLENYFDLVYQRFLCQVVLVVVLVLEGLKTLVDLLLDFRLQMVHSVFSILAEGYYAQSDHQPIPHLIIFYLNYF